MAAGKIRNLRLKLAALALALLPSTGFADGAITAHHGKIYITGKAGQPTQGFIEIDNAAGPDLLTGISCPIADASLLVNAKGAAVAQLQVPSGQTLRLTPSGPHIVLHSTHFAIDPGGAIPCSLTFRNAGAILVYLYSTPAP